MTGVFAGVFGSYSMTLYATSLLSLLFFPTLPWITESPYYLLGAAKYEESKCTLKKLRKGHSESTITAEYKSLEKFVENSKSLKRDSNWLQYFVMPSTRRPLICCVLLNIFVASNGTNVIFLYSSVIFPPNEYFANNSYPLILSLTQMASSVGATFLLDAFPRRHLYLLSAFLSFVVQSSVGIAYYEYSVNVDDHERVVLKWIVLIGSLIFWILSNSVIMPLSLILRSEILPLSVRGLGNSICLICQSGTIVVCLQLFVIVQKYFGTAANFAIFSFNSLLMFVVVYFWVPETRGKTLAEVQEFYNEGSYLKEADFDSKTKKQ